jgi:hypothetical protein
MKIYMYYRWGILLGCSLSAIIVSVYGLITLSLWYKWFLFITVCCGFILWIIVWFEYLETKNHEKKG